MSEMTATPADAPAMGGCAPQPVAVRDLRCGDRVHVPTWLGVIHWFPWGTPYPSWPVPGKWQVAKHGTGTLAVFGSPGDIVMVCGAGHCRSPLCGYQHSAGTS